MADSGLVVYAKRALIVRSGMDPDDLSWPPHDLLDEFEYSLDLRPWLKTSALTIASIDAPTTADSTLVISPATLDASGGITTLIISGGTVGVQHVGLMIHFTSGRRAEFVIQLPVVSSGFGLLPAPAPATAPSPGTGSLTLIAGAPVSGHRALMIAGSSVVHADPSSPGFDFVGISLGAAALGSAVQIATSGQTVTEPSWAWTVGDDLFVGPNGVLTSQPPTHGVSQQVAVATSTTTILVMPFPSVVLN